MRTIGASTVGSDCICAIALFMRAFHSVVREDDEVSARWRPRPPTSSASAAAARASMRDVVLEARMPVTRASTPASSATLQTQVVTRSPPRIDGQHRQAAAWPCQTYWAGRPGAARGCRGSAVCKASNIDQIGNHGARRWARRPPPCRSTAWCPRHRPAP